ncbi:hypothetical protein [Bdellovibrio svalbardensis]|uniref:Outer membrane protein beta-barrel domain-containing protein n=1 Tax=Bdellovibrio svalbardensis TaxID=2972972 RepID=A0ABT6DKQ2_9BACT|nr:hypothetical protein [Bdellovibrio svalbardensis]MDG0817450.1 hypothetical protein [Bdellovibrio svalbardensis]
MKSIIFAISLILFIHGTSFAASVTQVKNQKVLINLEGDDVLEGDEFFLLNPAGKKTAIIRVKQVKNGKALADILKGKADVGFTLQAKASSAAGAAAVARSAEAEATSEPAIKEEAPSKANRDTGYLRNLKDSYGLLGEYIMNTMNVNVKNTATTPALTDTPVLKGTSFGVGGFYDYIATPDIAIQVAAFLEQIQASGTATIPGCSGGTSTDCNVNITYGSLYGMGKYYLTQNRYRIWAGVGGGFLLALSKSATALNESQIATNQIVTFSVGTDIQMGRKNYIPVSLQYNYFPPSDTVKASSIVIKAGWAWNQK